MMSELKHEHAFTQNGRTWRPASDRGNEKPMLAPAVYVIKYNDMIGFHMTEQEAMVMPSKTYGHNSVRAEKILNTFIQRPGANTGVLLTGNKGSGKTLLAKDVCCRANEMGFPVLLLETPFAGAGFNEFMNSIVQPCVVFIDEFEKKYDKEEHQNALLSLLDGTGVNNKLYLCTSNSEKVSEFLISRPSRIFYHWRYGKLAEEVLEGYCKDNLKDQKHVDNMKVLLSVSSDMSFDIMQSIVEELNRYPEYHFVDLISDMNISLGDALRRRYVLDKVTLGDEELQAQIGYQYMLNLIELQEGTTRLRVPTYMPSFATAWDIKKSISALDAFWYNSSLMDQVEKGEVTKEEAEERYDNDFEFNFKFDPNTDHIGEDQLVMVRPVGGSKLTIRLKTQKEDPASVYFRRLFK